MPKIRLGSGGKLRLAGAKLRITDTLGAGSTAATGVTVTDFAGRKVFQRGVTRTTVVSGTYTGPASSIKARFAPVGTLPTAASPVWSTLVSSPTGGVFSGTLVVPVGGPWVVQVADGIDASVAATGSTWVANGAIIALLGQSNMQDPFSQSQDYPIGAKTSLAWIGGVLARVGNINDAVAPGSIYPGGYTSYTNENAAVDGDPLVRLCNELSASIGVPVIVLPYAVGGTQIASWQPGGGGSNWTTFAAAAAQAGSDFEGAIWLQGESDAGAVSPASWKTSLANIHAGCHAITGRNSSNFSFGVGILGPCTTSWRAEGLFGPMRIAQLEYVAANAGASIAACLHDGVLADGAVHMTVGSRVQYFRRFAEWARRRNAGSPTDMRGPQITGATRAGNVVTVSIAHNGGSTLIDGAGGAGAALQGFRYFDSASAAVAITASAIISATQVRLTLAAAVAGTLDYAMANAPYGSSTAASSVVYDNQAIPSDSVGLPLQPHAAMTVA